MTFTEKLRSGEKPGYTFETSPGLWNILQWSVRSDSDSRDPDSNNLDSVQISQSSWGF